MSAKQLEKRNRNKMIIVFGRNKSNCSITICSFFRFPGYLRKVRFDCIFSHGQISALSTAVKAFVEISLNRTKNFMKRKIPLKVRSLAQNFFSVVRSAARSAQWFFLVDRSAARSAQIFFEKNWNPGRRRWAREDDLHAASEQASTLSKTYVLHQTLRLSHHYYDACTCDELGHKASWKIR